MHTMLDLVTEICAQMMEKLKSDFQSTAQKVGYERRKVSFAGRESDGNCS